MILIVEGNIMNQTILYGVKYIEVEFGQRDEGWALYHDKLTMEKKTRFQSDIGTYEGGYYGPERPLSYYEIPIICVEDRYNPLITNKDCIMTAANWSPRFKNGPHPIN